MFRSPFPVPRSLLRPGRGVLNENKPMDSVVRGKPKSCCIGIIAYERVILIEMAWFSYGKRMIMCTGYLYKYRVKCTVVQWGDIHAEYV